MKSLLYAVLVIASLPAARAGLSIKGVSAGMTDTHVLEIWALRLALMESALRENGTDAQVAMYRAKVHMGSIKSRDARLSRMARAIWPHRIGAGDKSAGAV